MVSMQAEAGADANFRLKIYIRLSLTGVRGVVKVKGGVNTG